MQRSDIPLAVADGVVLAAFVLIGRDTHNEAATVSGFATTLAPFIVGLAVSWFALGANRARSLPGGIVVALSTVAIGMVVRRSVFGEGTAAVFVVVALAFILAGVTVVRMASWYLRGRGSPVRS